MRLRTGFLALTGLLFIAIVLVPSRGQAQDAFHVHIDEVDNSKFPQLDAYIAVSDASGLPIESLPQTAFSVSEDGNPVSVMDLQPIDNTQQPLAIALLLDTSASMASSQTPTPLQKAVEAAKSFVNQLTPEDQVAIIKFSDTPQTVLGLTTDKDQARLALDGLQPEKSRTVIFDAIVEGTRALSGFSGRRIIVLVTDGKDTHSGLFNFDNAVKEAEDASIPVYPLGFGNVINAQQLKQIADLTGGAAYIKASVFDLAGAFDTVLHNLRKQYKISYLSALPANNTEHEMLVAVNYQGGQQQASYRFDAKNSPIPIKLGGLQEGQKVGGMVRFAPTIDWPALKSLDILVDGAPLANITAAPYEYTWNSTDKSVSAGLHEFLFEARDAAGNTGQATIHLDVQPPIVLRVSNLAASAYFGKSVVISAELAPSANITPQRVEILVDGTVIATLAAPPYQTEWKVLNTAGPHVVAVRVYDANGSFLTEQVDATIPVGFPGWIILVGVLGMMALVIPLALHSRRRAAQAQPVPVVGRAVLHEIEGLSPGQTWPLGIAEIRLGRKRDENDIPLKGLNASRRQATICFKAGRYQIIPLSPDNPVLINNAPVMIKTVLRSGDLIRLGGTILRFEN